MWSPDYYVHLVDLGHGVNGVTVPNSDGTFDIYLNSALPEGQRRLCLEHEKRHILSDHFYQPRDVNTLEQEAGGAQVRPNRLTVFDLPTSTHIPLFSSLRALNAYLNSLDASLPLPK